MAVPTAVPTGTPAASCPVGRYLDSGGSCQLCKAGTYSSVENSESCSPAVVGKFDDFMTMV